MEMLLIALEPVKDDLLWYLPTPYEVTKLRCIFLNVSSKTTYWNGGSSPNYGCSCLYILLKNMDLVVSTNKHKMAKTMSPTTAGVSGPLMEERFAWSCPIQTQCGGF
jgi:hypothetical protein